MVKRFMCIKVLHEDGEHASPTHVRVVTEIDYDALAARLAEVAAIAHDGGLHTSDQWETMVAIRRLTLPHWNKAGSEVERKVRVAVAFGAADSASVVHSDPPEPMQVKAGVYGLCPECGQGAGGGYEWHKSGCKAAASEPKR